MRRFLFENGLSLLFALLFAVTLLGQSFAGQRALNAERQEHGGSAVSWLDYVLSADFGGAVMENWQSEFMQFAVFILATIWLVQRGSNESKPLDSVGLESKQKQKLEGYAPPDAPRWAKARGAPRILYENSLLLVMGLLFFATWAVQSLSNWRTFNEEQAEHGGSSVSWSQYVAGPDFWERTLQNWQSEFLAIGAMAVFTIFLRQRGSPESKPVGAPHEETGTSG